MKGSFIFWNYNSRGWRYKQSKVSILLQPRYFFTCPVLCLNIFSPSPFWHGRRIPLPFQDTIHFTESRVERCKVRAVAFRSSHLRERLSRCRVLIRGAFLLDRSRAFSQTK